MSECSITKKMLSQSIGIIPEKNKQSGVSLHCCDDGSTEEWKAKKGKR